MNPLKLLVAGAATAVIVVAFRDFENRSWLRPASPTTPLPPDETEPVLGYDGMDVDTLIDWLDQTRPDRPTLRRMRQYEIAHRGRQSVLAAIDDQMDDGG